MTNANDSVFGMIEKTETNEGFYLSINPSLTKREYFAAMAMQGIVSNHGMIDTESWRWLAKASVAAADELINALNQNNDKTTI